MSKVVSTLRELVEIKSESKKEDDIVEYLVERLQEFNPNVFEKYVKNVLINQDAKFWVVTHLDTVPFKRSFEFDGVYAYGTGCCDAKASLTAIILALEDLDDLNFGVALLSDEEEDGLGSKAIAEHFNPRKAVVMEPTELKIANRHYGSLEIDVEVLGESMHGAYPEMGINAIEKAMEMISNMKSNMKSIGNVLIQRIEGGSSEYVVPGRCSIRLEFTFPPEVDVEDVELRVREIFENFVVVERARGFVDDLPTVERAVEMSGLPVKYTEMRSWTDAVNLKVAGWNVVVFGPGELHLCHTEKERIRVEDIVKTKEVLLNLNDLLN